MIQLSSTASSGYRFPALSKPSLIALISLILLDGNYAVAQSLADEETPALTSLPPLPAAVPATPLPPLPAAMPSVEPLPPPAPVSPVADTAKETPVAVLPSGDSLPNPTTASVNQTPVPPLSSQISTNPADTFPDLKSDRIKTMPTKRFPLIARSSGGDQISPVRTRSSVRGYARIARSPILESKSGLSGQGKFIKNFSMPAQLSNPLALIFPLSIPAPITSFFGWRLHPITGYQRFHTGTDIGAPEGTPVLASFAGRVEISDWIEGYGLSVSLKHRNEDQETFYAHLSEILIRPGQCVSQGQIIGRVGSTGLATGPNLHFELRRKTAQGWRLVDAGSQLQLALSHFQKAGQ